MENKDIDTSDWLSASEIARKLHVHPSTVSRWAAEGRVPHWKVGSTVRIPWSKVLKMGMNGAMEND